MNCAIVGSFDPWHAGHEWLYNEAYKMFGNCRVIIAVNPKKEYAHVETDRLKAIHDRLKPVHIDMLPNGRLLKLYCVDLGIDILVKGVRSVKDYEYEVEMAFFNADSVRTILLPAPIELVDISSTKIREGSK